jgi:4-hydroxy-4-methyl-2-oxoglutarate aldolase
MTETPTKAELDEFVRIGPATIHEAQNQKGAMDCGMKPLDPATRMIGMALTVAVKAGDILPILQALHEAKPGEVIVVDGQGFAEAALAGELMAHQAKRSGVAGMVIDGAVRDSAEIVRLGFPLFCRHVTMKGPTYKLTGAIGEPINCGGVGVENGDIVCGDRDGIVVVGRARWREVLAGARERDAKEASIRSAIAEGRTLLDALGLSPHHTRQRGEDV